VRLVCSVVCFALASCVVDGGSRIESTCDPGFVLKGDLCVEATGTLDATWQLDPGCPPGSQYAELVAIDQYGAEWVDEFACSAGGGSSHALPLGSYDVFLDLVDAPRITLLAQSFLVTTTLVAYDEAVAIDFVVPTDVAYFTWSWDASGCAAAGVASVEISVDGEGSGSAPCSAGTAQSSALALGNHAVFVRRLNGSAGVVGESEPEMALLEWGNQFADLGVFEL
jgi:hypothetical protein